MSIETGQTSPLNSGSRSMSKQSVSGALEDTDIEAKKHLEQMASASGLGLFSHTCELFEGS